MKNTVIVSAFPGTGKSYIAKNNKDLIILDSDSSEFSWISKGVRNPEFPKNYIEHIKENIGKADVIFVSTHKEVRRALALSQLDYTLVYPNINLRNEYIERYEQRGNDKAFIDMMENSWENFILDCSLETRPEKIRLCGSDQYISDILNKVLDNEKC